MRYYAQYNDTGTLLTIGIGPVVAEIAEAEYTRPIAEIREKAVHCGRGRSGTARDRRRRTFRH